MMKFFKVLVFCLYILIEFTACNFGGNTNLDSENMGKQIIVGNITSIPATPESSAYAVLQLENNSNRQVTLSSVKIITAGGNEIPTNLISNYVRIEQCERLDKDQQCQIKVFANHEGSYLLKLNYTNNNHNSISLSQLIGFNSRPQITDGIAVSTKNISAITGSPLSIPFLLGRNFSRISVKIGSGSVKVYCSNGYGNGSLCTAVIDKLHLSEGLTDLEITGYDKQNIKQATMISKIMVTNNSAANIIVSAINPTINPSGGNNPVTITIFNNGSSQASNLNLIGGTPVLIQNNTCANNLLSESTCSFNINAISTSSGSSQVILSYLSNGEIRQTLINVAYTGTIPNPQLTITSSGSFVGVASGDTVDMTVNIKNTGNVTLDNLQYNNLTLANSAISTIQAGSTCINGESLVPNNSCNLLLEYHPSSPQLSGQVNFIVTSSYFDQSGSQLSYSNSSLAIPYSSGAVITITNLIGNTPTSVMGITPITFTATMIGVDGTSSTLNAILSDSVTGTITSVPSPCTLTVGGMDSCNFTIVPWYTGFNNSTVGVFGYDPFNPSGTSINLSTDNGTPISGNGITDDSISYEIATPYIYLAAPNEGAVTESNVGITWGIGGAVNPRFSTGTSSGGGVCPIGEEVRVDNLTGLMWMASAQGSGTYADVELYVSIFNSLSFCGYTDWRIPNVKELHSLINYAVFSSGTTPANWLNSQGFSNFQPEPYWTNTIDTSSITTSYIYYIGFLSGTVAPTESGNSAYVILVRGGE